MILCENTSQCFPLFCYERFELPQFVSEGGDFGQGHIRLNSGNCLNYFGQRFPYADIL